MISCIDCFDLPWSIPFKKWPTVCSCFKTIETDLQRHIIILWEKDKVTKIVIKEYNNQLAEHDHQILSELNCHKINTITSLGYKTIPETHKSYLATEFFKFEVVSLEQLIQETKISDFVKIVEILIKFLIVLHKNSFWWGDAAPSNVLFQKIKEKISPILIDIETMKHFHGNLLSEEQRKHDIQIFEENMLGEIINIFSERNKEIPYEMLIKIKSQIVSSYERMYNRHSYSITSC
ncbi:MAG: hypothetical protein ACFFD1_12665 [Candidatus Thorarchaeota archaeon]